MIAGGSSVDRASCSARSPPPPSGGGLLPGERTAAELALASVCRAGRVPTLPAVVDALLQPEAASGDAVHTNVAGLASDGRDVALELRRMVDGDLAGMFDGPTTTGIALDGSLVVLDLSALYASPALGILMTCATAWLQSTLARQDGRHRLVVVDEAWAILSNLAIAKWLQACFKLESSVWGVKCGCPASLLGPAGGGGGGLGATAPCRGLARRFGGPASSSASRRRRSRVPLSCWA